MIFTANHLTGAKPSLSNQSLGWYQQTKSYCN